MTALDERTELIDGLARSGDSWSATFTIDRDDPCFFDHPLDHVPAIALVSGLLALARAAGLAAHADAGTRIGLSLSLPAFCELAPPVRLELGDLDSGGSERTAWLAGRQDGRVVCEGSLTIASQPRPAAGRERAIASRLGRPVDAALVHRRRQENVLIDDVVSDSAGCTATIRRPPRGHVLAAGDGRLIGPEMQVEAARQFGTLLCHAEHKAPRDTQFVLLGIEADIACGLPGSARLSWWRTPPSRGRRASLTIEVAGRDGQPAGRVAFDFFSATPAAYQRLRDRKAAA